jgi:geranylgeranyl diphosphate synthase, type II
MLIHLFRTAAPAERTRLTDLLGLPREERTPGHVRWVRELMDGYGSIDYARQIAHGLAGAAMHEFSLAYGALPESRDKRFLEGLATWVFERT